MRKKVMCAFMVIVCFFISSCYKATNPSTESEDVDNMNNKAVLMVNGKKILCDDLVVLNYSKQYAQLPLITILKELGGEVKWVNKKKVTIFISDTSYVLNPLKKTLKKEGESFNIIAVPPGTKHGGYYKIYNREFIIDSDSLYYFINLLDANITVDYDNAIVSIESRKI